MQDTYAVLIGTVAVLVILVLIALIARQYRESGGIDGITKILPAFFVVIVAVIVLGQIADIGQDDDPEPEPDDPEPEPDDPEPEPDDPEPEPPYEVVSYSFDASTGTLTVSSNVPDGYEGPWDSYAGNVKSLVIEDGVGSVGTGAFASLTALKSLTIPDEVSFGTDSMGVELKDVFGQSTEAGGEYASLGDGVMYLCDPEVFTYSEDGTSITGLSESGKTAVALVIPGTVGGTDVTSIAAGIPSSPTMRGGVFTTVLHTTDQRLQNIGTNAFNSCTSLASVDIPSSVTSIGDSVFNNCTSLASVDIPSSVTSIGNYAFRYCTSLTSVDIPSSVTSISNGAFQNCTFLTSVDIPSSVTSIGERAFDNCKRLASVDIPSSVTSIGNYAFNSCTSLASVDIPSSVTSIGNSVFYMCESLASVDIPSSVTSISERAFQGCKRLASVDIPSSVTSIGERAFSGCTGTTNVSFGDAFAASLGSNWAYSWYFYDSDGTTEISKTAANLAGHTFIGTASKLVKQA